MQRPENRIRRAFAGIATAFAVIGAGARPAQAKNLRIAMVLWRDPHSPAEAGFKDRLKELGYSADYTTILANQDRGTLRSLFEAEISPRLETFDYVYSFGTTASQMVQALVAGRVPQLFNIVSNPVAAGIAQSLEAPGGNISGASNYNQPSAQIEAALLLFKFKRLGLLFNPRETNSMATRQRLQGITQQYGMELVDLRAPPAQGELQDNLRKLAAGEIMVDAVFLPEDSFILSQAALIGPALRAAGIKAIGTLQPFIDHGALIGVVPDYYELGQGVAGILDRNRKGEPLGGIPVYQTRTPTLFINGTTATALGVAIPAEILAKATILK